MLGVGMGSPKMTDGSRRRDPRRGTPKEAGPDSQLDGETEHLPAAASHALQFWHLSWPAKPELTGARRVVDPSVLQFWSSSVLWNLVRHIFSPVRGGGASAIELSPAERIVRRGSWVGSRGFGSGFPSCLRIFFDRASDPSVEIVLPLADGSSLPCLPRRLALRAAAGRLTHP